MLSARNSINFIRLERMEAEGVMTGMAGAREGQCVLMGREHFRETILSHSKSHK